MREPAKSEICQRLAEGCRTLEALEHDRRCERNPNLGKAAERRIVQRELLELELQNIDEQMEEIGIHMVRLKRFEEWLICGDLATADQD